MLLSKSIAITILFSALAVVQGAPISVDSTAITLGTRGDIVDIYPRGKYDKPGTTLDLSHGGVQHQVTLGNSIGHGKEGAVHAVTGHTSPSGNYDPNHLLVKEFHAKNTNAHVELGHLQQVGQLHASGQDENGRQHALITKQPGVRLKDTQSYKSAKRGAGRDAIKEHGAQLVGNAQVGHADAHGLLHKDNHSGNVLFEEEEHNGGHRLTKANFVDWGKAEQAPQRPATGYTQAQRDAIHLGAAHDFRTHG